MLSNNELKALVKKATRGAGYSWGLAEEAAYLVLQLHRQGYNGAQTLLALLDYCEENGRPAAVDAALSPSETMVCPLSLHAYLSDSDQRERAQALVASMSMPASDLVCPERLAKQATLARLNPEHTQRLMQYAARCYAPDTEASRISGAGAGLNDND